MSQTLFTFWNLDHDKDNLPGSRQTHLYQCKLYGGIYMEASIYMGAWIHAGSLNMTKMTQETSFETYISVQQNSLGKHRFVISSFLDS